MTDPNPDDLILVTREDMLTEQWIEPHDTATAQKKVDEISPTDPSGCAILLMVRTVDASHVNKCSRTPASRTSTWKVRLGLYRLTLVFTKDAQGRYPK